MDFWPPRQANPQDATARSVGVGWHIGCDVSGIVSLCKQRSELLTVSEGARPQGELDRRDLPRQWYGKVSMGMRARAGA